jgi:RNA polymerase sigma factor for flagellar operon FliA
VSSNPETNRLIEENLPLVKHIVFQVSVRFPRHVDREELNRAGVLGLVQAAHRYDPAQGVPFTRFAAQRIQGAVLDAVRSTDWAPRSVRKAARGVESVTQSLLSDLGRLPTPAETAEALGMTTGALASVQEHVSRSVVLTLDMAVLDGEGDDDVATFGDLVCDQNAVSADEELENRELCAYLRDAVDLLPERHRLVIDGYFFRGQTSEELADKLGVSISRISQIRSEAFEMLRDGITAQYQEDSTESSPQAGLRSRRKAAYAAAITARSDWKSRLRPVA